MVSQQFSRRILRIGLAFAFLYPPINALTDPYAWVGYFPSFMHGYVSDLTLLHAFGVLEIVIALWILWGRYLVWPTTLAAVLLISIVSFNTANFQVVFRDLAIASIALFLAVEDIRAHSKP